MKTTLEYHPGWQLDEEDEAIVMESKKEQQAMFNRVAFGGERVLYDFNGAEVAIVPMEDYALLEAFDGGN